MDLTALGMTAPSPPTLARWAGRVCSTLGVSGEGPVRGAEEVAEGGDGVGQSPSPKPPPEESIAEAPQADDASQGLEPLSFWAKLRREFRNQLISMTFAAICTVGPPLSPVLASAHPSAFLPLLRPTPSILPYAAPIAQATTLR